MAVAEYLNFAYRLCSAAATKAVNQDFVYSTACVDPEVVDAHVHLVADPANLGLKKKWGDVVTKHNLLKYLSSDRAVYSSFSQSGLHKYLFLRNVQCKNADRAINDPVLIASYLLSITGFNGVVFPDDPLYAKLEQKMLSTDEYYALLRDNEDVLESGKRRLLKNAMSGKMPPQRFVETILDGTRQGVRVSTTNKHTFRDGYSLHMFQLLGQDEGDGTSQIRFLNQGEGKTTVPFFGPINNAVASMMWMASGIAGASRYDLFMQALPKTDDEVQAFVDDSHGKFLDAILDRPERGFLAAKAFCCITGTALGPLNTRLVAWYMYKDDLAKTRAEAMLESAKHWNALQITAAKKRIDVDDAFMAKYDLMGKAAKSGEFLRMLQLAVIKDANVETRPLEQQNQPGGLYDANGERYYAPLIEEPRLGDPGHWDEDLQQELQRITKTAFRDRLVSQGAIIQFQESMARRVNEYLENKTASLRLQDIQASIQLDRMVNEFLVPILAESSPAILEGIWAYATQHQLTPTGMELQVFRRQVTTRVKVLYLRDIYAVFADRGGLLEVWVAKTVEMAFWGPEKRQKLVEERDEAIQQEEESTIKLKEYKDEQTTAQGARAQVLREAIEQVKEDIEKREAEVEAYEDRLKLNKRISKGPVPKDNYQEQESFLLDKLS
ncbi:hypothetical protein TrVGV298_008179 [Trichoderma virens]|nr:hypothetical protein TrVGV298_008179 [Trichoderma virens]